MEKLVIVGSGPAGLTAGIYAARAELSPVLIAGLLPGGLLTQTTEVENFPGFPEGVDGFTLVDGMRQQAERFGVRTEYDEIAGCELTDGGIQKIRLAGGGEIETRALIIATGATPRWLGLPSEERLKNHGVSACATCDGAFFRGREVAVVGGGDSALEEAIFLSTLCSKVTVIHRRDQLRASKIMAERALANSKIAFAWDSVVSEVLGADKVEGVELKNVKTDATSRLDCAALFIALGHVPATKVFRPMVETDENGFILVQHPTSRTNLAGVFAAGDCMDHIYRQAVTAAGSGCRAAIDAERYLAE